MFHSHPFGRCVLFGFALTLFFSTQKSSIGQTIPEVARALPDGESLEDRRLGPLKDLDGYFPFDPPKDLEEWETRAAVTRRQLQIAVGLYPWPEKTALNAVIHGKVTQPEYTVERVYFESMPGFFVTGSLYRPRNQEGPFPAVLSPHGHWANGRFYDAGEATAKQQMEIGAEVEPAAARSPLQARCVHLARMGCVVFHYDMLGYADSQQISGGLAHQFATQREHLIDAKRWGLFSPQAESHLQSIMGLQTWNSIRALDFLESLADVDPKRLAVTGASGGGTQTFILGALDPRPATVFPAVMVSTAMQGGCTCENCSLLRVDAGNVEFAALFAPKPMAMSAADDWTKEMATKGYPQLQQLYKLLGAADQVALISRTEFGHNYNHVCRTFMYEWFQQHLELDGSTVEAPFQRLTHEEMTVWNEDHPRPPSGEEFEVKLLSGWQQATEAKFAELLQGDAEQVAEGVRLLRNGIDGILRRRVTDGSELEWKQTFKSDQGEHLRIAGILTSRTEQEQLPLLFLYPKKWNGTAVLWLTEKGKAGLFDEDGEPSVAVQKLIDKGICVAGVDLLYQGEFPQEPLQDGETRWVNNSRQAAGYTFGYNHSLLAHRVHDVLNAVSFLRSYELTPEQVGLIALDATTAPIAAAARVQAQEAIDMAMIDTTGFRFINVSSLRSPDFLPGGAKYGDLPGMLAAAAPNALLLAGEGAEVPSLIQSAYRGMNELESVSVMEQIAEDGQLTDAAIEWLLAR